MKIHRRLIVLVALGMLLIIAITISALQEMTAVFSRTTREVERISLEFQRIWEIENTITRAYLSVRNFVESGDERHRMSYEDSRSAVHRAFREMTKLNLSQREMKMIGLIMADFYEMEKKSGRILALRSPKGADRTLAGNLMTELDGLHLWMGRDIAKYKEEGTALTDTIMKQLHDNKVRVNILFLVILATSIGFLFILGVYLYRKVSVPLNDLWEGTEAISRGSLDYRIPAHAGGDIARLGERFNEMAQKLKQSYADLEQKLLDRTRELAALDSVALTLSESGSLREVLHKSLIKVLDNLAGIEPKGGIFLCEPNGEHLRLTVHVGLPPEFVQREETIKMGECLCGMVAQSGEMLFTENGCEDPRHTHRFAADGHSHIIIPLKSRGIVLGVMFLYPTKNFALKPSDIQMLDSIGIQLGMAVENLRFYSEVKESSEKYWDLFENSRDILFIVGMNGRFTAANKASEKFLGYSRVELFGKSVLDFLTEEGSRIVRSALAGERVDRKQMIEFEVVKRDGSHAFVEVGTRRIFRDRTPLGFHVSVRDVTEQKRLREMLLRAERLAAIGQVGIAVRHEINNPLTTVIGNTELLIERYENADDELKARLQVILNNALRIAEIVKRLEGIKQDKVVEYLKGVKMTDLEQG